MESSMAVSREVIRKLRESKAWSQQHLADASGLSLRTIQRVEAEGTASAETRLAIAAVLNVPVEDLTPVAGEQAPSKQATSMPSVLVFAASGLGVLFVLWLGSQLPDTVASHYGVSGKADDQMSREVFIGIVGVLVSALPSLLFALLAWAVRHDAANLPNKEYWFSAPNRQQTLQFLDRHSALFCVSITALLCYVFWLVVSANTTSQGPTKLNVNLLLAGLGAFLAFTTVWLVAIHVRFSHNSAS